MTDLVLVRSGIQHYAWGSPTLIPNYFGWPITGEPLAEVWIGDHPALPSTALVGGRWVALPELIAAEPGRWLGTDVVDRYGPHLPMLLKVLGIGSPLSLQAHPTEVQAREGFAREDALGIDRSSPDRSYRDDRAKPEMICALTRMEALCGFRDLAESRELFAAVGGPLLPFVERLSVPAELPGLIGELLSLDRSDQRVLTAAVGERRANLPWSTGGVIGQLADAYPDDAGSVVALLLNVISLEPGEALYLPAGNLHAYLRGLGVEVMGSSDNVLRGGLTPKHVDVPELVRTLVPEVGPWPRTVAEPIDGLDNIVRYRTPSPEVGLIRATVDDAAHDLPPSPGPTLFLLTSGQADVSTSSTTVSLKAGDAALGGPGLVARVRGTGELWRAEVRLS